MTAANPAAHVHRIMNYEEPPYPEDCGPCVAREERIRVLEAEVERLQKHEDLNISELRARVLEFECYWHEAEAERDELKARVKELTAMLYELRSQRDYAMAVQEDRER